MSYQELAAHDTLPQAPNSFFLLVTGLGVTCLGLSSSTRHPGGPIPADPAPADPGPTDGRALTPGVTLGSHRTGDPFARQPQAGELGDSANQSVFSIPLNQDLVISPDNET